MLHQTRQEPVWLLSSKATGVMALRVAPLIYICIQSLIQQEPVFLQLLTILNTGPAVAINHKFHRRISSRDTDSDRTHEPLINSSNIYIYIKIYIKKLSQMSLEKERKKKKQQELTSLFFLRNSRDALEKKIISLIKK